MNLIFLFLVLISFLWLIQGVESPNFFPVNVNLSIDTAIFLIQPSLEDKFNKQISIILTFSVFDFQSFHSHFRDIPCPPGEGAGYCFVCKVVHALKGVSWIFLSLFILLFV